MQTDTPGLLLDNVVKLDLGVGGVSSHLIDLSNKDKIYCSPVFTHSLNWILRIQDLIPSVVPLRILCCLQYNIQWFADSACVSNCVAVPLQPSPEYQSAEYSLGSQHSVSWYEQCLGPDTFSTQKYFNSWRNKAKNLKLNIPLFGVTESEDNW